MSGLSRSQLAKGLQVEDAGSVTGHAITMDEARELEQAQRLTSPDASNSASAPAASSDDAEPVVLSFAQLQALIEAGKADQIPNNKIIPDELNVRACPCLVSHYLHFTYIGRGTKHVYCAGAEEALGGLYRHRTSFMTPNAPRKIICTTTALIPSIVFVS